MKGADARTLSLNSYLEISALFPDLLFQPPHRHHHLHCSSVVDDLGSWGRFLKHVVGNLKKHKTTEEKMVEAAKKSGRTWKQRVDYLASEDEDILDFIIEEQAYSRTGGVALFKDMAAQKVVEGRTWKSLRNRFIHIMDNLNDYDFLHTCLFRCSCLVSCF